MRNTTRILIATTTAFFASTPGVCQDDPLSWLEPPRDGRAIEWAQSQTQATRNALSARPESQQIMAELKAALKSSPPRPSDTLLGKKIVRFRRDQSHPHGILEVAAIPTVGKAFKWRVAFDVDAFRAHEGKPYEVQWRNASDLCLPPAYDRCLLRLSPGGGDQAELREFDLLTGQFVTNGFHAPVGRVDASWISTDQVVIATTVGSSARTKAGWAADVRLWKRGQSLADAPIVTSANPSDAILHISTIGSGADRQAIVIRGIDYTTYAFSTIDQSGTVRNVDLPRKLKEPGLLAVTGKHLIVQLGEAQSTGQARFPAEAVLAYDVRRSTSPLKRVSVITVPANGDVINDTDGGFAGTESSVHIVIDNHLMKRVVTATPTAVGWALKNQRVSRPGNSLTLTSGNPAGENTVMVETGFLTPDRVNLVGATGQAMTLFEQPAAFNASRFVVEIRSARSKDGTPIDYYLLRPRNAHVDSSNPTLMTGYGAFGVSVAPSYLSPFAGGAAFKLWLDRGGSLALPIIRGGGERGEAWHEAALREKRQRSYDDFIAVAEQLEADRFTSPAHLGIFGLSNGGLLVATVAVQRPDLFGAVVSDVPLTDMLRFPSMGMGSAWIAEYGDPSVEANRKYLLGYSPYQNVRLGVRYPPFLITASTEDDRVGPGHARKLAARLTQAGANAFYYEDQEGGHMVSDALARPELISLRMTFLISTLMEHGGTTPTAVP